MQRLERLAERALALPAAAFLLLTPPILTIFEGSMRVFGIPPLYIYLFGVWLIAIAVGRHLARRLLAAGERRIGIEGETAARDRDA